MIIGGTQHASDGDIIDLLREQVVVGQGLFYIITL